MTADVAVRKTFSYANMASGAAARKGDYVFPVPITAEWAWGDGSGAGVRVCVMDSGVSNASAEVGPVEGSFAVARPEGESDAELEVVPDALGDVNGHGTACAAIIRRVAPAVRITSLRLLGPSLGGSGRTLIRALDWAIDEGFDVVNLSLSTSRPAFKRELHDLADKAFFQGVVIVAAAHNMPVESFPWRFPSVISVGSHNAADAERLEVNARPPVEFFAAGVQVPVPQPNGLIARVSGNSFAAPHVAGMAARILARHPTFRVGQIKHVLAALASNLE